MKSRRRRSVLLVPSTGMTGKPFIFPFISVPEGEANIFLKNGETNRRKALKTKKLMRSDERRMVSARAAGS